ncbi:unnamed protein product [Arabis nemorensis]|uniref:Uncharacterized protein n=1 Tax=Arabis nemorensis TaxID=586526 RepID=A0A565BAC5_9BRAS|nr:unnamed protein product [Arabis nemorensis]
MEYKQRVRRHIKAARRAELNFMMHLVAANDLVNFLKWDVCRVAASKEEPVAAAVKGERMEMAAKYGEVLESVKEKFKRKEAEITVEIHLQERIANLQLLEDLSAGKNTISREMRGSLRNTRLWSRPWWT